MRIISLPSLLTWASQWVLWLIFADNVGFRELVVGGAASVISTFLVILFLARTSERFRLKSKSLIQALDIPGVLLHDTWILLRTITLRLLGKQTPSQIVSVPFHAGGNDPDSRGCRALAITFLTLTPNTLVLGILKKENLLFFHTLVPQPLPSFMNKMGARPEHSR